MGKPVTEQLDIEQLMTTEQVAERLCISKGALINSRSTNSLFGCSTIPFLKSKRKCRYRAADVQAWLDEAFKPVNPAQQQD